MRYENVCQKILKLGPRGASGFSNTNIFGSNSSESDGELTWVPHSTFLRRGGGSRSCERERERGEQEKKRKSERQREREKEREVEKRDRQIDKQREKEII